MCCLLVVVTLCAPHHAVLSNSAEMQPWPLPAALLACAFRGTLQANGPNAMPAQAGVQHTRPHRRPSRH